jgi:hypothetical protein
MPPRGSRLACTLKTVDGCHGSFDVTPGEQPNTVAGVGAVTWDRQPQKPVVECAFSVIGDLGMTGQVILVNPSQWRALTEAQLEKFFYAALLWGKSPYKVIEDAQLMLKRAK